MIIRPETKNDQQAIYSLTEIAFEPMKFSDGTEQDPVDQLRNDGDLLLSLIAEDEDKLCGHVAFSPVKLNGKETRWVGLGPIAVLPDQQHKGIGSQLIANGLAQLKALGYQGCALIGNPNYYQRFGFRSTPDLKYRNVPTKNVMQYAFTPQKLNGELQFSPGLE